jgi:hypothetical protein
MCHKVWHDDSPDQEAQLAEDNRAKLGDRDKSKPYREWITGLLIPLVIFIYGCQKDDSDRKQRDLDRLATIIRSLGSTSPAERSLARSYIDYLSSKNELPAGAVELLSTNASTAATKQESSAAVATLSVVKSQDPSLASAVDQAVKKLPSRLFIQIRSDSDRDVATQVQSLLASPELTTPGIEVVKVGPSSSEVRYFYPEDKDLAQSISQKLTGMGIPTSAKDSRGFAKLLVSSVPKGQLELWLAPGAKLQGS